MFNSFVELEGMLLWLAITGIFEPNPPPRPPPFNIRDVPNFALGLPLWQIEYSPKSDCHRATSILL
jgi:hypothetical protein